MMKFKSDIKKQNLNIVVDTSVFIGLINRHDHWHKHTLELFTALQAAHMQPIYLDCVISESMSTTLRRFTEQKRVDEINSLFERFDLYDTSKDITWVFPKVPKLYPEITSLMRSTNGDLNFNDALIAIICREYNIPAIASYDTDFDQISWLKRISKPSDI